MQSVSSMNLTSLVGSEPNYKALATQNEVSIPDGAVAAVNQLFIQMRAIFPAWRQSFPDEVSYREAKRIWLETLVNEGITTIEQLRNGIEQAKKTGKPFWPSVGEFVRWCQFEDYYAFGLPTEDELRVRLNAFMSYAKYDKHLFDYRSKAEYWLLSTLYQKYWDKTTGELEAAIPKVLKDAVLRVKSGFEFPDIPIAIEQQPAANDPEMTARHIAKLKQILKGKD